MPSRIDANSQQARQGTHPLILADLEDQRIHQHERERLLGEGPLIPSADQRIEPGAQRGDGGLGEARPTQLLGDLRHLPGRDAVDDHLHEREHERRFAALVAGEELRGELAVAYLGHPQRELAHSGGELTRTHTVAVPLPLLRTLVALRPQLLAHLRLQHLVQDLLQELGQSRIAGKQALHGRTVNGNLIVGHPSPPSWSLNNSDAPFSLRGGGGGFLFRARLASQPSSSLPHPISSTYWTSLVGLVGPALAARDSRSHRRLAHCSLSSLAAAIVPASTTPRTQATWPRATSGQALLWLAGGLVGWWDG